MRFNWMDHFFFSNERDLILHSSCQVQGGLGYHSKGWRDLYQEVTAMPMEGSDFSCFHLQAQAPPVRSAPQRKLLGTVPWTM